MIRFIKKQSPARLIAFGFLAVIFIGSILLILPCSVKDGVTVKYIDALYTSASAVCVTGLVSVDVGTAFTPLGQFFLAALIQIGGLGVTSIGAGIILAMGKKLDIKSRMLVQEASNLSAARNTILFVKNVFIVTVTIELIGAALSFIVLVKDYPALTALGYSLFHSVAAFNNSGFDNLGHSNDLYSSVSLSSYQSNILFNLVTCILIFLGGIGFLVIRETIDKRFRWKKLSMHSKVVLSVSTILIVIGTILLKLTEDISWLGAFFHSVSARTAGFSTYPLGNFTKSGLLLISVLMFIGASSGSTGGGIKTSTFFVLLRGMYSAATNKSETAFHYAIPKDAFKKASVIALLALGIIISGSYLMSIFEPQLDTMDILFETISAFGTVGLSTGITPDLTLKSKLLSILIMYIGRLGPLTVATLWYFSKGERTRYAEGNISIG